MPISSADTTLKTKNGQLLITNRNVRFRTKSFGNLHIKSILLNKITSVELKSDSNPAFLIIGIIIIIASYFLKVDHSLAAGALISFIFVAVYFITIKRALVISSSSDSISFTVPNFTNDEAVQFIDNLEHRI